MSRRYLIVGAGAAGIAASEAIREQDPAGEILMVSDDPHGYYSRPGLAYYLTGEMSERWLYPFSEEDFARLRLQRLPARVTRLHPGRHEVAVQDGGTLSYDRLLLATGSRAFLPPLSGLGLEGVVKLDDMEDARLILKLARRGRAAVVVGGGITALEIVEGLRARRVKTHYFMRRDRYWSNVLDEAESKIIEHRLKEDGVQMHYHTELAEILGQRGRVEAVRTQDGRVIQCRMVAIAVGVRPHMELAEGTELQTDRGILADQLLETNIPDIFAAGDVAQVLDPLTGKSAVDTLWNTALAQGRVAGLNMAGKSEAYQKGVPFNVTRLAGLTTTIIGTVGRGQDEDLVGIARGDSETWRQLPDAIAAQSDFEVNRLRLMVGERTLIGAIVMGDQTLSRPLQDLIVQQVDITPIYRRLLGPQAPLAEIIVQFWSDWRRDHAAPQL